MKTGDAKPWIYRHIVGQDSQAAGMKRVHSVIGDLGRPGNRYMIRTPIRLFLTFAILITFLSALAPAVNVQALTNPFEQEGLPSQDDFIRQVSNGQAGELRGIYIPGILAAPVVQQPSGMGDFVSPWQNIVTQFSLASRLGSTGLLAHNYLAGEAFGLLQEGQEFALINGNGSISTFTVTEILRYQAVKSESTFTRFLDLESGTTIASADLFTRVYSRPGQVIFQTCIQAEGDLSWGRLFVIASPSE